MLKILVLYSSINQALFCSRSFLYNVKNKVMGEGWTFFYLNIDISVLVEPILIILVSKKKTFFLLYP